MKGLFVKSVDVNQNALSGKLIVRETMCFRMARTRYRRESRPTRWWERKDWNETKQLYRREEMIQESCSSRGGQLGTVLGACKNMTGPVHRNSIIRAKRGICIQIFVLGDGIFLSE